MSIQFDHTRVGNWEAMALANDALRIVVVPELGGKMISLTSCDSGHEWLWKNPHLPLQVPPSDVLDFGPFDSGGWDEVFPSIAPCRVPNSGWGSRKLTDHGELWYRSWRVASERFVPGDVASLTLAVDHAELPFYFERTLTLRDGAGPLTIDYQLVNRSDMPLPYLWAAHPLLAIEPGDSIRLPAGTCVKSIGSFGCQISADATSFTWPDMPLASGETLDLSHVPERAAAWAAKLFVHNVSPACVEIVNQRQGSILRFSFGSEGVPHLGLWLNYGGWSGAGTTPYFNAGFEPTTSPHDDLSAAIEHDAAALLPAGQKRNWLLLVETGAR